MIGKIGYYRGLYRVRVVTESEGYWIVEALEEFADFVDGKNVLVLEGERRIVLPELVYDEMVLALPVKEHAYELEMEEKVKRMIKVQEAQVAP